VPVSTPAGDGEGTVEDNGGYTEKRTEPLRTATATVSSASTRGGGGVGPVFTPAGKKRG
jgi:hypothetical protein